jgi:hypothetical protein
MKINITLLNALGTFSGIIEQGELSKQEAQEQIDIFVKGVNKLTYFCVRADDGGEFVFNEEIIRGSVIKFKIVE